MIHLVPIPRAALLVAATMLACGRDTSPVDTSHAGSGGGASSSGAGFSAAPLSPAAGGKVISVEASMDEAGNNRFVPSEIAASPGDVIRFTLKSGVHNVHFLADSNATAGGFPMTPSDMLQMPGQTVDVRVAGPGGKYYFQCDPHALLGMVGHVVVK